MKPSEFRSATRRIRELADSIDAHADATAPREVATRTRAINDLSRVARDLARRNRGLSVADQIAEDAAALGARGGAAGTGAAKVRGGREYYARIGRMRWKRD